MKHLKTLLEKEKLRLMISGANRYGELQEYRQTIIADARATIENPDGKPGAPLPASPMAPLAATGFKSFGGDVAPVTVSSRGNIHGAIVNDLTRVEAINIDTSRTAELLDPSTFLMRARSDTPGTDTQPSENEKPKPVIKQTPVLDTSNS